MMKKTLLFCWLLAAVGSIHASIARSLPESDYPAIVAQMERAFFPGGRRQVASATYTYESGSSLVPGGGSILVVTYKAPGEYCEVLTQGGKIVSRKEFDGSKLFFTGVDGQRRQITDHGELALMRINTQMSNPTSLASDIFSRFQIRTVTGSMGVLNYLISGLAEGVGFTFTIDGGNFLISSVELSFNPLSGESAIKTSYFDYRNTQGIMLPYRIESSFMNVNVTSKLIKAEIKFKPGEEK